MIPADPAAASGPKRSVRESLAAWDAVKKEVQLTPVSIRPVAVLLGMTFMKAVLHKAGPVAHRSQR